MNYSEFLEQKLQLDGDYGFTPEYLPDFLFPFQRELVSWSVKKGRAAMFADCGMGKTVMELVWAENVRRQTGRPVLILTPIAVTYQFIEEANKFGIAAERASATSLSQIQVTNYERLHLLDPSRYGGVVCDESSILKSFNGVYRREITEFMRRMPYRLLGTATAAPNDYVELGTSSEALGYLGYMDMLSMFFTNRRHNAYGYHGKWKLKGDEWRFKGHAEDGFWRWVSSWARALRFPSDLGFSDDGYILPDLVERTHVVTATKPAPGMLFTLPAKGLREEREERVRTVKERCQMAADLVNNTGRSAVVWCHRNDEGDLLERLIPDAIQVSGVDDDEQKEVKFKAFSDGTARVLITKPKIGAWGLNWQHCSHIVTFPSHSYEQYYQAIRRCWRFGQQCSVTVDIVSTEGEIDVMDNLQRKARAADEMFTNLVKHMHAGQTIARSATYDVVPEVPKWLGF